MQYWNQSVSIKVYTFNCSRPIQVLISATALSQSVALRVDTPDRKDLLILKRHGDRSPSVRVCLIFRLFFTARGVSNSTNETKKNVRMGTAINAPAVWYYYETRTSHRFNWEACLVILVKYWCVSTSLPTLLTCSFFACLVIFSRCLAFRSCPGETHVSEVRWR